MRKGWLAFLRASELETMMLKKQGLLEAYSEMIHYDVSIPDLANPRRATKYLSTSSATTSQVIACAWQAMKLRSHCLCRARSSPAVIPSTLGSTKIPKVSEKSTSPTPPTCVATTGAPHANDSRTTFGMPSRKLAKQLTSAALYHSFRVS